MNCLDKKELEQFLKGKLDPERLLAVDEHVSACAECKAALCGLPPVQKAGVELGAALLNVEDCPDYVELSAYVDRALGDEHARAIAMHANACEPCTRDIEHIQELRSHAAMREKVVVRPGMSKQPERRSVPLWRRVFAGVSAAAVVTAVAITLARVGTAPTNTTVAIKPPASNGISGTIKPDAAKPDVNVARNNSTPVTPGNMTPQPKPSAAPAMAPTPAAPTYTVALNDGAYSVVKKNGKLQLAKSNGAPVRDALEAQLEASIAQKLKTGKIKPAKSTEVALASTTMRDKIGYEVPPTAPKPVEPAGRIVMDPTPVFNWSKVDLAVSYRLQVFDAVTHRLVASETTEDTSFTLEQPLQRGRMYKWQASAKFSEDGSWSSSAPAKFEVLSDEAYNSIQHVKDKLPGSHLALGSAYEYYGLYDQAALEYRLLRRSNPHSDLARKLLHGTNEAGR